MLFSFSMLFKFLVTSYNFSQCLNNLRCLTIFIIPFETDMENLALGTACAPIYECFYRSPWHWSSCCQVRNSSSIAWNYLQHIPCVNSNRLPSFHFQPFFTLIRMCASYLVVLWFQWPTISPFCWDLEPWNWRYNGKLAIACLSYTFLDAVVSTSSEPTWCLLWNLVNFAGQWNLPYDISISAHI